MLQKFPYYAPIMLRAVPLCSKYAGTYNLTVDCSIKIFIAFNECSIGVFYLGGDCSIKVYRPFLL